MKHCTLTKKNAWPYVTSSLFFLFTCTHIYGTSATVNELLFVSYGKKKEICFCDIASNSTNGQHTLHSRANVGLAAANVTVFSAHVVFVSCMLSKLAFKNHDHDGFIHSAKRII